MKDKVKDMFAEITMPDSCAEKIRREAAKKEALRRKPVLRPVLATVMALALVLCLSPQVRAAVDEWVTTTFRNLDLTIYEKPLEDGQGGTGRVIYVHTEQPTFAHMEDGRLYFTGNGENLDITDEIREDKPYFYQYVDEETGMTICLVVGMAGNVENFGVYEFIKDTDGEWIIGTGRNDLDPETNQTYPWVGLVWEELEIPWPMPGTDSGDDSVTITRGD